jgi:hypothetical protein
MSEDTLSTDPADLVEAIEDASLDADSGSAEDDEPTQAAQAIAAMGLTRMSLQELKENPRPTCWPSPKPWRSRTRTPCASRT